MENKYKGKKILLIEQNPRILSALERYLIDQDTKLYSCQDFSQAYSFMQREQVDHIICDYQKNNDHAYRFLEKLQNERKIMPNMLILTRSLQQEMTELRDNSASNQENNNKNIEQDTTEKTDSFIFLEKIFGQENQNVKQIINPMALEQESFEVWFYPMEGEPYNGQLLEIEENKFWASTDIKMDRSQIKDVVIEYVRQNDPIQKNLAGEITTLEKGLYGNYVVTYCINNDSLGDWKEIYQLRQQKQNDLRDFLGHGKGIDE